jgi:hypothetical protein
VLRMIGQDDEQAFRRRSLRDRFGDQAAASDYRSDFPFVGAEAASLARFAATSRVPEHPAHRSFPSLSDDPYPLQCGHHS